MTGECCCSTNGCCSDERGMPKLLGDLERLEGNNICKKSFSLQFRQDVASQVSLNSNYHDCRLHMPCCCTHYLLNSSFNLPLQLLSHHLDVSVHFMAPIAPPVLIHPPHLLLIILPDLCPPVRNLCIMH